MSCSDRFSIAEQICQCSRSISQQRSTGIVTLGAQNVEPLIVYLSLIEWYHLITMTMKWTLINHQRKSCPPSVWLYSHHKIVSTRPQHGQIHEPICFVSINIVDRNRSWLFVLGWVETTNKKLYYLLYITCVTVITVSATVCFIVYHNYHPHHIPILYPASRIQVLFCVCVCEQRFLFAYMCRSLRVEILSALITELGATWDGSVYCYWHLLSHPPFILNSPLYGPKHVYIHPIIPYFLHNVYHDLFRRWSPS